MEYKTPWGKKLGRPLRIFGMPWHIAHQYELLKIPEIEWFYLRNHTRKDWKAKVRPIPENMTWVTEYEEGLYDLALLHVDQQCIYEPIGKGKLFRMINEQIQDIPKIVLNHGTPFWPEMFPQEEIVEKMKEMLGPLAETAVVNSAEAREMWGFGEHIQHGMDAEEWYDLPKEPRVVTMISPAGLDKYYNRELLQRVQEQLRERHQIRHCHITVDWVAKDWDSYRRFLGSSLIYFNPTLESPMPRSRTEAFLSGCAVVTLNNHNVGDFFEDGESAVFAKNNVLDCVDKIAELFYDYERAVKIGKAGQAVARQEFSGEKFRAQWIDKLTRTMNL